MKELLEIQQELKAPKNQRNNFGNYNYRSCEDILEAVKPLLKKHECILVISDQIESHADRVYICATAMLKNKDGHEVVVTGMAREPQQRKGMDDSQITGATSSYARKYALNGLFCIDDTKDADATNTYNKEEMNPKHKAWGKALEGIENGLVTIDQIKKKYMLTEESEKILCKNLKSEPAQ